MPDEGVEESGTSEGDEKEKDGTPLEEEEEEERKEEGGKEEEEEEEEEKEERETHGLQRAEQMASTASPAMSASSHRWRLSNTRSVSLSLMSQSDACRREGAAGGSSGGGGYNELKDEKEKQGKKRERHVLSTCFTTRLGLPIATPITLIFQSTYNSRSCIRPTVVHVCWGGPARVSWVGPALGTCRSRTKTSHDHDT